MVRYHFHLATQYLIEKKTIPWTWTNTETQHKKDPFIYSTIGIHCIRGSFSFDLNGKKRMDTNAQTNIEAREHMCIVHRTSTLNDKLCINLNLLTFILNVLILILLTNAYIFSISVIYCSKRRPPNGCAFENSSNNKINLILVFRKIIT